LGNADAHRIAGGIQRSQVNHLGELCALTWHGLQGEHRIEEGSGAFLLKLALKSNLEYAVLGWFN